MAHDAKWVFSCKNCHAECTFAQIPEEGVANWFFPKKPQVPGNYTHKCDSCGHEGTYQRHDLIYRDATMPSRVPETKCGEATGAPNRAAAGAK